MRRHCLTANGIDIHVRDLGEGPAVLFCYALASGVFAGATIRQPSYFLTGAKDGLNAVRKPTEEALRSALTDLRGLEVLPEAGHWPQLEEGARVNAALLGFLPQLD